VAASSGVSGITETSGHMTWIEVDSSSLVGGWQVRRIGVGEGMAMVAAGVVVG
jgi:hypothetical protein